MNEIALALEPHLPNTIAADYPDEILTCNVEFFSALSHELRTPLTAIKGFAQGLMVHWEQLAPEKQYQYVEHILRSSLRLERLVYDLSLAARLVQGVSLQCGCLDVATTVAEAIEEAQVLHKDRAFTMSMPLTSLRLWADHQRMLQVLLNLLDNAAKYSPLDGPVVVRWLAEPPMVRIDVCDSGACLSPDEQRQLFRRFGQGSRSHRAARPAQGSGLGLFICKALVEAMGGAIGVQVTLDAGNTFWFTLPQATI
ncbi:MAG TPA: HAMP domain-containing sensor histidine kinase [Chloroflexota bacterium]|jgi:signal transduction histidine kinase|nr:HAMP domain-containing sensor histidine kinase [Chloroflexota bacterium]